MSMKFVFAVLYKFYIIIINILMEKRDVTTLITLSPLFTPSVGVCVRKDELWNNHNLTST